MCVANKQAFLCDCQQNPVSDKKTASSGGPDWPSQLTHGLVIASYPDNTIKISSPLENLQTMGFNMLSDTMPRTRLLLVLQQLPGHVQHRLSGNGMHLPIEAAWMLYCIMHTARRDDRLPVAVREVDDEDDNAEWG